ncbi:MAG: signal peptidase II [Actinobacteria bacterium]|nr:MAG: signal peptidase II [Actinomycetota bacterium]
MKKLLFYSTFTLIILFDQLTKLLIRLKFQLGESIALIKGIFHFTYVQNTGVAFGLFQGYQIIFQLVSLIVVFGVISYYFYTKPQNNMVVFSLSLISAGAISNFIDRLYLGKVIDFLDIRVWPVFNIADSAIVIGVLLLVISSFAKGNIANARV